MRTVQDLFRERDEYHMAKGKAEGKAEGIAEGKAEGIAEGKAEGIAEGEVEARRASMHALMANLGMSAEEAMDALNVPADQREGLLSVA